MPQDLAPAARNQLKTLSKENADEVARHLAMAAQLIDEDPALAHEHALAATRRAGRIAVVRETAAITAYTLGDYALALRELRTYRRISGKDDQIALMVDSERGVGRPDRALELGRSVDRTALAPGVRVELAIAMSGARLDLGETERALIELEIPELDPDRAFEWSPPLFAARAAVLEELGRAGEAETWYSRATIAADALDDASGAFAAETIIVDEVEETEDDVDDDTDPDYSDSSAGSNVLDEAQGSSEDAHRQDEADGSDSAGSEHAVSADAVSVGRVPDGAASASAVADVEGAASAGSDGAGDNEDGISDQSGTSDSEHIAGVPDAAADAEHRPATPEDDGLLDFSVEDVDQAEASLASLSGHSSDSAAAPLGADQEQRGEPRADFDPTDSDPTDAGPTDSGRTEPDSPAEES